MTGAARAVPLPERIGPYRVEAKLGEGAMGLVYRAVDEATGERVAVKTLRTNDETTLRAIRREVRALARLRHEGVVAIRAEGLAEATPWYAMELLHGTSLREALPAGPAPDAAALRARLAPLRDVARTLAAVHGEGLVHGDLKPENVHLRPDGSTVLLDFGLARRSFGAWHREQLDDATASVEGTPDYMAPEQVLGERIDARADLYALGCVLYEAAAGRPPFQGTRAADVLLAHLHEAPPPLAELCPAAEGVVASLADRLLEKRPVERAADAAEVDATLGTLGVAEPARPAAPARRVFNPAATSGRVDVLQLLRRSLDAVKRGQGGLVLLGGSSGLGKTRILAEAVAIARAASWEVILAGGAPGGSRTLPGIVAPLVEACRRASAAERARLLEGRAPWLACIDPAFAALGGVAPARLDRMPRPAVQRQLAEALLGLLEARASRRPVLLLVDDLQWADVVTTQLLLRHAAAGATGRPALLAIAAYRTEETPSCVGPLRTMPMVQSVELAPLDDAAIAAIVSDAAPDAPGPLRSQVAHLSGGSPLLATEILRALLGERGGEAPLDGLDGMPPDALVASLLVRRMERLSGAGRRVLAAQSVFGRLVREPVLAEGAGMVADELADALGELVRCGILDEQSDRSLAFSHDRIRELVLAELTEEERSAWHRRVADALAAAGGSMLELARHRERGGETVAARAAYGGLVKEAQAGRGLDGIEEACRGVMRLSADRDVAWLDAVLTLAEQVLRQQGCDDELQDLIAEAVAAAARTGELARQSLFLRLRGLLELDRGEGASARASLDEAARLAASSGDTDACAWVLIASAKVAWHLGDLAGAQADHERALALPGLPSEQGWRPVLLSNHGACLAEVGRNEEARAIMAECLALGRQSGDRLVQCAALDTLGSLALSCGAHREACARYGESLALAREMGALESICMAANNLAVARAQLGELEEVRQLLAEAIPLARRIDNPRLESVLRAAHASSQDDAGEALGEADLALQLAARSSDPRFRAAVEQVFASIALRAGRLEMAAALLESCRPFVPQLGPTGALVLAADAKLARLQGRHADALRSAGAAVEVSSASPYEAASARVELGMARAASGADGSGDLAAAREIVATLGLGPRCHLMRAIAELEAALS